MLKPPARGVVTCMGKPALQVEWAFRALDTYLGGTKVPRTDSPYDTMLEGHTEETSGSVKTTWQRTFQADVPGAAGVP